MTSGIRAKKDGNEEQMHFQRGENTNESKNRQESKQTLLKKFKNREGSSQNNNEDVATLLSDEVDYTKLAAKERAKTKNLKVKREYFILQKRNRQFL